jgi:flagellar transcriptional activator FlhD
LFNRETRGLHSGAYDTGIIGARFADRMFCAAPTRIIGACPCIRTPSVPMMASTGHLPTGADVKTEQLLEEIREANMSYLILAQHLIRKDKAEALYRLGVSEEVADIIERLSTAQILKIAASNMLMCRFRFDDEVVWNLLTSHGRDRGVAGAHAAILMAAALPEAA